MKALVLALALTGCAAAQAGMNKARIAAGYAVTISDLVCPLAVLDAPPALVKACAAMAPVIPFLRGWAATSPN